MEEQNNTNPEEEKNEIQSQESAGVDPIQPETPPEGSSYTQEASQMFTSGLNLGFINEKVSKTRAEIGKYVIGQHDMVDLLLISIFANGHVF